MSKRRAIQPDPEEVGLKEGGCPACHSHESRELQIRICGHSAFDVKIGYWEANRFYEDSWEGRTLVVCEACGCVFIKNYT